jgi:hypothetical protein
VDSRIEIVEINKLQINWLKIVFGADMVSWNNTRLFIIWWKLSVSYHKTLCTVILEIRCCAYQFYII